MFLIKNLLIQEATTSLKKNVHYIIGTTSWKCNQSSHQPGSGKKVSEAKPKATRQQL